jgi:uncharacterized protein YbjT (DUF2867 family)
MGAAMILIIGATGKVGSATLQQLTANGEVVRALVRSPEKAAAIAGPGIETSIADLDQPHTLEVALQDVTRALLISPRDPNVVELQCNFIDVARRIGPIHIVKLSGLGTSLDSPLRTGRWHAQIEAHLATSGLPFTHLHPPYFMQNTLRFAPSIAANGQFSAAMGPAQVAMIDIRDIAAVAATALTTDGHAGRTYRITGPEVLSHQDIARTLTAILGKPVSYQDVPLDVMCEQWRRRGTPAWEVEVQLEYHQAFRHGTAATITDTVEAVTGMRPRPFEQFVREHLTAFTGA